MYSSSYLKTASSIADISVWLIISVVLAIVGGLLVYFLFLSKKNEGMFMEALLKITYLIVAIYITLSSFAIIGTSFIGFLVYLIVGNLIARIVYEFSLILLVICRNTTEINKSLKGNTKSDKEK